MSWKWIGDKAHKQGFPGVPERDLTDEEFEHYSGRVDRQFPDQPGALARAGLYRKETPPRARRDDGDEGQED